MNLFFIENLSETEKYHVFVDYMVAHSDYLSFVFFKYHEGEKTKKTTKDISLLLKPYKRRSKVVNRWPGTVSLNENKHIYRLVIYDSSPAIKNVLNKVDNLYEWDYPKYPMDLCFYKNGYAWFSSSAHENCNWLYLEEHDRDTIRKLTNIGLKVLFIKQVDKTSLFQLSTLD